MKAIITITAILLAGCSTNSSISRQCNGHLCATVFNFIELPLDPQTKVCVVTKKGEPTKVLAVGCSTEPAPAVGIMGAVIRATGVVGAASILSGALDNVDLNLNTGN